MAETSYTNTGAHALLKAAVQFKDIEYLDPYHYDDPYNKFYGVIWLRPVLGSDGDLLHYDCAVIANHARVLFVQFSGGYAKEMQIVLSDVQAKLDLKDPISALLIDDNMKSLADAASNSRNMFRPENFAACNVIALRPDNKTVSDAWHIIDGCYNLADSSQSDGVEVDLNQVDICNKVIKNFCPVTAGVKFKKGSKKIVRCRLQSVNSGMRFTWDAGPMFADIMLGRLGPRP